MSTNIQTHTNNVSYSDLIARCRDYGMPETHIQEIELLCGASIQALSMRFGEWSKIFCEDRQAIQTLVQAGYPIPGAVLH